MSEVEVALAISAREWPDRLHRFLADHGGARVRAQVLTPEDALAEDYQVLIIDDVSSFLTPRLVQELQRRRRQVLGVFDPNEAPDAKERLRECGVDQVIESEATADEFVIALRALIVLAPEVDSPIPTVDVGRSHSTLIGIGGPPGGCGATEVAIAMATILARRTSTVLVDMDESAPAMAQRLGVQLLPNLRTAIDLIQHHRSDVGRALSSVNGLDLLTGLSGDRDWMEIRPIEVLDVLDELRSRYRCVVMNVGAHLEQVGFGDSGRFGLSRSAVGGAHTIVAVGLPHPVSVSRLIGWSVAARELNPRAAMHLIVNRCPRRTYRRAELREEIGRAVDCDLHFLPNDDRVTAAAWAGDTVRSGPFVRALRSVVAAVVPS